MASGERVLAYIDNWFIYLMVVLKLRITLYVRSLKIAAGEKLVEELHSIKPRSARAYEISRDTWFKVKLKKIYSYVLPDDQKALVERVKQLSERRGHELRVIDVARENAIHRLWRKLKGINNFPTVETNLGGRLEAPFSQNELERFISESALPH